MGKVLEFPIDVDLLKYLSCEKSARVMDKLTRELKLKLDLSKYGDKSRLMGKMEEPSLEKLNYKKERQDYKKALNLLVKDIKGGSLLTVSYSANGLRKGYVTSGEGKTYLDLEMEEVDGTNRLPLLSARIHNAVEGEGNDMQVRYVGQLKGEEVASLYVFDVTLNSFGNPTRITLSSYDYRTIVFESDDDDTYDMIRDIANPIPRMTKKDDIDLVGPGLSLSLIFDLEEIRKRDQNPVGFSK